MGWSEMYDSDGYCLDLCEYGYDEETMTCLESYRWDMFTETAYRCADQFYCGTVFPGDDDAVWEQWNPDEPWNVDFRIGYFDAEETFVADCLSWDRFVDEFNSIKLYED